MTVNYNELYRDFISRFPENSEKIKTIAADSLVENSDGMHVLFGIVVIPFVKDLMNNNQTDKITTAFEFFEDMAKSTDEMISEVLEFTVLEDFISEGKEFLTKCLFYMGPETKKSCQSVMKYMKLSY